MNRERRRDIVEAVGLVALVASLIFLGLEIQQNTVAVKSQANQGLQNQIHAAYALYLDDAVTDIVLKGIAEPSALSYREAQIFEAFWHTTFNAYQNIYFQVQAGTFDEELADGWWQYLRNILDTPGLVAYWETRSYILSREFRDFVESEVLTREVTPNLSPQIGQQ